MLLYFLSVFLLIVSFVYYKYTIKPKRELVNLKKKLQALGYKVEVLPFAFLDSGFVQIVTKDFKDHKDCLETYKNLASKQVDIILHNILDQVVIQVASPILIKQLLTPQKVYDLKKAQFVLAPLILRLGTGIIFKQHEAWKISRKHINSAFTFGFILNQIPQFVKTCDQKMSCIESQKPLKQKGKAKLHLLNVFTQIFSTIFVKCFFGDQISNQKIKGQTISSFFTKLMNDLNNQCSYPQVLLLGAWVTNIPFLRNNKQIKDNAQLFRIIARSFIKKRIEQIKNQKKPNQVPDLIETLVNIELIEKQKVKAQIGSAEIVNIEYLVDEFQFLYLAGTDTTSHMTLHLIYSVALNPRVQERLRKQIDQHITGGQSDFSIENLKKIRYIDWLQNQSLRVAGPGNFIFWRQAVRDHYLGNIPIFKGQKLGLTSFCNHYNPKYFKDPFQFRPQRWEKQCDEIPPFVFTAFSGGPRNCLGKQLALLQSKVAVIKFMKRYKKIELPVKQLQMKFGFFIEPEQFQTQLTLSDE